MKVFDYELVVVPVDQAKPYEDRVHWIMSCNGEEYAIRLGQREMLPLTQFIFSLRQFLESDSTDYPVDLLFSAIVFHGVQDDSPVLELGVRTPIRLVFDRKSPSMILACLSLKGNAETFITGEESLKTLLNDLTGAFSAVIPGWLALCAFPKAEANPFHECDPSNLFELLSEYLKWESANGTTMILMGESSESIAGNSGVTAYPHDLIMEAAAYSKADAEGMGFFRIVCDGVEEVSNPYVLVRLLALIRAAFADAKDGAVPLECAATLVNTTGGGGWTITKQGCLIEMPGVRQYLLKFRVYVPLSGVSGDHGTVVFDLKGKAQILIPVYLPMLAMLLDSAPVPTKSITNVPTYLRDVWPATLVLGVVCQ